MGLYGEAACKLTFGYVDNKHCIKLLNYLRWLANGFCDWFNESSKPQVALTWLFIKGLPPISPNWDCTGGMIWPPCPLNN